MLFNDYACSASTIDVKLEECADSRPRPCSEHIFSKGVSPHIPHEANSEQMFPITGKLSDPTMQALFLAMLTRISVSKTVYIPTVAVILTKYKNKFSTGGNLPDDSDGTLELQVEGHQSTPDSDGKMEWDTIVHRPTRCV